MPKSPICDVDRLTFDDSLAAAGRWSYAELSFAGRVRSARPATRKGQEDKQALVAFLATTPSYRVAASPPWPASAGGPPAAGCRCSSIPQRIAHCAGPSAKSDDSRGFHQLNESSRFPARASGRAPSPSRAGSAQSGRVPRYRMVPRRWRRDSSRWR